MRSLSRLTMVTVFVLCFTRLAHAQYPVEGSTAKGNAVAEDYAKKCKVGGQVDVSKNR